jgi:hypothetical protein
VGKDFGKLSKMPHFMKQTKDRQRGGSLHPIQVKIGFDDLVGLPDLPHLPGTDCLVVRSRSAKYSSIGIARTPLSLQRLPF